MLIFGEKASKNDKSITVMSTPEQSILFEKDTVY